MYCSGYAYVGTSRGILPTMDMPLPELLMVDMLLPAMNMICSWWIRPLPEPSMTDMFSWIQPFSTIRKLLIRTGFLLDGERPDLHFKLNPKQMCLLNMSGSSSQTIAWSWYKRGSPKIDWRYMHKFKWVNFY